MVSPQSVEKQLKKLKFNPHGWGKAEVKELPHVLVADEEIYELANGFYEGGFALLVATNIRVLLIDKKPLNYLTVEDLRFDMINEIDYSHRLMGAYITITTGSKALKFTSTNQPRLRKLITHVQHCMAEVKMKQTQHQEGQVTHLEKINEQLQSYLLAQQQYQEQLHQQLQVGGTGDQPQAVAVTPPEPIKPSPELADYLYAQRLLAQYRDQQAAAQDAQSPEAPAPAAETTTLPPQPAITETEQPQPLAPQGDPHNPQLADLYAEGMKEIFGRRQGTENQQKTPTEAPQGSQPPLAPNTSRSAASSGLRLPFDVNPLKIAASKLPLALRNRRFGRPSFHAHNAHSKHSQAPLPPLQTDTRH